jgi:hypothetical protein
MACNGVGYGHSKCRRALGSLIGWRRRGTCFPSLVALILLTLFTRVFVPPAIANIYRWDNGELITEKDAEPGADRGAMSLEYADLNDASLAGARFSNSDLTDAHLGYGDLTNADLSLSDLRGTHIRAQQMASAASTTSTIESTMTLDPTATLQMVFEDDDWGSTISFEPGIDVSLDGTLELTFANGTRPADLVGTTLDLFDWDGAVVTGEFAEVVAERDAQWDQATAVILEMVQQLLPRRFVEILLEEPQHMLQYAGVLRRSRNP